MRPTTGRQWWTHLDGVRSSLIRRWERYAQLTLPAVLLPEGHDQYNQELSHDYQSLGAQAVNHLTNKVLLALAAPSRPAFRLSPTPAFKRKLVAQGVSLEDLLPALAAAEREAVARFDARGQRPKLYHLIRLLIVTGNALVFFDKDTLRVMSPKFWCVKRDVNGKVRTLVIREQVCYDELDPAVQKVLPHNYSQKGTAKVDLYKLIERRPNGDYHLTTSVDDHVLPSQFHGKWSEENCPYRVMTWQLPDENDYGIGLIEEHAGDFEATSVMAEGVTDGGVLGAEVRWGVNPGGETNADTFAASKNGDAIPARREDISPLTAQNHQAVAALDALLDRRERRIAQAFLMMSAVTRDAERVTAEEIRATARELETAYGGVYSSLAIQVQAPLARWCLDAADLSIAGTQFEVVVITGLEALSRGADLENFATGITYLANFNNIPPALLDRFNPEKVAALVGAGCGSDLKALMYTQEEYAAEQQRRADMQLRQETALAAGQAAAQQGTPQ